MNAAAAETIGYKRSAKTEWLSKDTWSMIEERKRLKRNLLDAGSPRLKERAATVQRERKRHCTERKKKKKSAGRDIQNNKWQKTPG